jgi:iron-sulfur cluster assembly accessory protein
MIEVTSKAAAELRLLLAEKQAPEGTGLRLMVERGGCAGLSYAMSLGQPADGDTVVEQDGVKFIVEASSAGYLRGSQVDYEDSLNDSGFKIHNPNAARSCGCGTSFEPAEKGGPVEASLPQADGEACSTAA